MAKMRAQWMGGGAGEGVGVVRNLRYGTPPSSETGSSAEHPVLRLTRNAGFRVMSQLRNQYFSLEMFPAHRKSEALTGTYSCTRLWNVNCEILGLRDLGGADKPMVIALDVSKERFPGTNNLSVAGRAPGKCKDSK
jgi:hypothetical protein